MKKLKDVQSTSQTKMADADEDVAVIGMGCNFPGGEGLDNFWKVLQEGRNCVSDIPAERFDSNFWHDADVTKPGKSQTAKAAFIKGFNEFDPSFFGIPEVEADFMDPQQKLLLQCSYRALEDAGIPLESLSGTRTGVYIGLMNRDYEMIRNNKPETITHYNCTGTAVSVAANRISFTFNLTGPSLVIDSACSSSLVALHLACQAIKQGDCEMALCGGVNCIIEPRVFVALSKARMISPEGTSKPFCTSADGYGRGEGCGVLLLKPLKKALKDCNKIWGVICKTAVNQDGHTVTPLTKPSVTQQEELLRTIYSNSDIINVQYIEAHGTGTPVGDPTEAASISNVIAKARPPDSETLWVGSVKGNIGHTESAAGVAGLIKVLLMMKHQTIVPSVFYSRGNSSVDTHTLNLKIPDKLERWETNQPLGRIAGVNSFGFGGTNAHVILREHIHQVVPKKAWQKLFVLSAASEKSLIMTIADTHQRLCSSHTLDFQALSYTSACGRSHFKHKYRKAFLTSSLSDLQQQLKLAQKTEFQSVQSVQSDIQVVFVFCGNGVCYRGMCRQLMRQVLAFKETIQKVEIAFQTYTPINISKLLESECDDIDISRPNVIQPLLFAVQVGIATLLKQWGVKPSIMLGHSVGEVAAAHCSGLLSLCDAVKVLHHRSTLQCRVTGGKMLVISNVAVEKIFEVLTVFGGNICVAAFNSPQSCTLSGDADSVDALHEMLRIQFADTNILLRILDVHAAYHSHMMDPILDDIESSIGFLNTKSIACHLFSTVTGERLSDGDFSSGTYWAKNIREPVLFKKAVCAVLKEKPAKGNVVFVEVGPRMALQRYICETLGNEAKVLPSVHPNKDCDTIASTLARLFEVGINVDWKELFRGCGTLPSTPPVYQFDNTKNEVNFEALRGDNEPSDVFCDGLESQIIRDKKECTFELSLKTAPYLWDHKNNGIAIVPGAFYVDLAYALVMANLKPKKPASLSIKFESVLTLNSNSKKLKMILEQSEGEALFKIQSPVAVHASGTCRYKDQQPLLEEATICLDVIYQRCKMILTQQEIYSLLSQAGFEYGPPFRHLNNVRLGNKFKEAVTAFQVPEDILKSLHKHFIHPVLLDYFIQMAAVVAMGQQGSKQGLPSQIASIAISEPLQETMVMYLRTTQETQDFLEVCGCFSTKDGKVLVEFKGVRISFLLQNSDVTKSLFFHSETVALAEERDVDGSKIKAIIFEDSMGIAKGLRPYICTDSVIVGIRKKLSADEVKSLVIQSLNNNDNLKKVLFIWGVENLTHLSSERILESFVTCCEIFRHIVLAVKETKCLCAIKVITYRSTELTVDHVSLGFVLSGMMRSCSAEIADIHFQHIDLASVTSEDIQTLACVIKTNQQQDIRISKGQASTTRIAQTPVKDSDLCEEAKTAGQSRDFVLQTTNPYGIENLCQVSKHNFDKSPVPESLVEIQLTNVCIHSSDYFPVSTSHLNFGRTFYWNKHVTENHDLLGLDFSGIVSGVGKDVKTLKLGDQIASCYPVPAVSKILIPEAVCYGTKAFPFFRETPCVSFFILAWEILQRLLCEVRGRHKKLAIISPDSAAVLIQVLAVTANRSGWNVSCQASVTEKSTNFDALLFLPPFNQSFEGLFDNSDTVKHVIFIFSSHMSLSVATSNTTLNDKNIHVHRLDVAYVLQKVNLEAQRRNISNWLLSLRLDPDCLPHREEILHVKEPKIESSFTTATVQQVVLDKGLDGLKCPHSSLPTKATPLFEQRCVYIVTGGLSGLGLETVKFIAHNGGGCIAILSRSVPSDEIRFQLDLLQKRNGVSVLNIQCDVSESKQVVDTITKIGGRFPSCPIKGVFHSAAVLHDSLIESLDESLFRKVLKPKVSGTLNLHFATLHNKLDYFVCYSSISSFIGNASQCNYAAANAFLDTFCHYRRNLGLAGQSINWGPLNLGLLLNKGHFQKFLETKGMMTMGVHEIHKTLQRCLFMNRPQQVICKFNFKNLSLHVLSQNPSLRERMTTLVETAIKDEIHKTPKVQRSFTAYETVRIIVSEMLNIDAEKVDDDSCLSALGIDSMLAMTLQNKIYQETEINVPLVTILDPNTTLTTLVSFVQNSM